jgi:hypothetical protein
MDIYGIAQVVVLYYVCVATTYNPMLYGEISQIIRFFLTQNQSTLALNSEVLIIPSSCMGCIERHCAVLQVKAIACEINTKCRGLMSEAPTSID